MVSQSEALTTHQSAVFCLELGKTKSKAGKEREREREINPQTQRLAQTRTTDAMIDHVVFCKAILKRTPSQEMCVYTSWHTHTTTINEILSILARPLKESHLEQ